MDSGRLLAWTVFVACLFWLGPRSPRPDAPARAMAQERPAPALAAPLDDTPDAPPPARR